MGTYRCIPGIQTYHWHMKTSRRGLSATFSKRRGETLAAVIVGTMVLGLAVSGIAVILSSNSSLESEYEKNNRLFLLQNNSEAVVRKVDTSLIPEGEIFFLKKDEVSKTFLVLTGAENMDYRYVNAHGEWVNTGTTTDTVYARSFLMEKKDPTIGDGGQVIRAGVKELIRK